MECKYRRESSVKEGEKELIDTLWNVNHRRRTLRCYLLFELIDTLWNVNRNGSRIRIFPRPELIDTLWNVNKRFISSIRPRSKN